MVTKNSGNISEKSHPNLLRALGRQLSHPESEVLQMQEETIDRSRQDTVPDEDLIDTLIAISVVAKRLAEKLRKEMEGERQNGKNE